jgi:hypothetical protein
MSDESASAMYEFRVKGILGPNFLSAFPNLNAQALGGLTVLSGALADQAALFGVLYQIEALGLELLAVNQVETSVVDG